MNAGVVISVNAASTHGFHKCSLGYIRLIEGLGVEGDAHMGATVKHRSRVARDPTQPNLRQVHLMHAELFEELRQLGFSVSAGQMGENITTKGTDLLDLPRGALLHLGAGAIVEVTGLRNPCHQLDAFLPGLMEAVLIRQGAKVVGRKAGIMGVVRAGGVVRPGVGLKVEYPRGRHQPLAVV